MPTELAVAAIVVSMVGAGVSAYGSYQTGKSNKAIANFNAANRDKEAAMQLKVMQTQANIQKSQAEQDFALRQQESQARFNNAISIENQAISQDKINRANLAKRRDVMAREQATQRASIAASGAVESSGTPLDLLAETAATIQQDQEEQHYINEVQRDSLLQAADQERLGGRLALAGSTLNRDSALTAAALNKAAASGQYMGAKREAQVMRLTGAAAARAGKYEAGSSLLSGVGSSAGFGANYFKFS
jgi:hypothetical protein